ncbi:MAG: NADP-dependent malic enzyme [Candidatus Eremiobacteraeota bacterium]|nr:NADP-dependent malic enzyme [Candidatus Eremiobacteraeota bacterium]
MIRKKDALDYHKNGRRGKIEVVSSKPCATQRDLSLAYTPGVAEPCREIQKNADDAYLYTAKGNLVAVVSNGTAVLGLGDIGALAGKPVMEGKGILFKRFADIDVFDIELGTKDPQEIVKVVQLLEPTFGGINLEDIKAPDCFFIEEKLKETLSIPVFHDDQHGTAIISGAALINALELVGKSIDNASIVISGAGAAGIACARHYVQLGAKKENIFIVDTTGIVYKGRKTGMNPYKEEFARDTERRTLAEAMEGADVLIGVSAKDIVSGEMVQGMAKNAIVFAMANPDPEITWEEAKNARHDLIMATGRSDYPNQVNNVLGFPFIFRGALDVRARSINDEMKRAATFALAALAKEDVPDSVLKAYGLERLSFGPDYIIPKPLDPRVLLWVAPAVARAAMETGVARIRIEDIDEYRNHLEGLLGRAREVMREIINRARRSPKRIVFPEGDNDKILRACHLILEEGIAHPILIGERYAIAEKMKSLGIEYDERITIVEPTKWQRFDHYVEEYYRMRQRKGVTRTEATTLMKDSNYFGSMMVHLGDADGLLSGISHYYRDTIRPALQIIRLRSGIHKVAGLFMLILKDRVLFFADPTVNIAPCSEDLAEIALLAAEFARHLGFTPRVAMLSFSNFGSVRHPHTEKVAEAVLLVKQKDPSLMIDGEMQVDPALLPELMKKCYPFSKLTEAANVFIFPELQSANIGYKLLHRLGGATAIGPVLLGLERPVHILTRECEALDVLNMAAITVIDAMHSKKR